MVPAFALMVAAACSGDPLNEVQGDLERLQADPSQLFLEVGESKTVTIEGVDAGGNPITAAYEVTDPGSGFDIRRDSTFLPVYVDDSTLQVPPTAERFRFVVTGESYGTSAFTVSAGGKEITIPVQVVPQNTLEATLSTQTPALGQTVTITAPPGTTFTPESQVLLPDTAAFAQPFTVSVAADGSSIDVILPPNLIETRLTVTNVTTAGAPSVTFAPSLALGVTTTEVPALTGTTSNLAPAVNEPVTITLGAGQTFDPGAAVLAGAVPPAVSSVTPTTITFIPAPGTTALPLINGVVLPEVPTIPVSLPAPLTDTIVVSPDVPTAPGTGAPGSAPTLITPALDRSSIFYDATSWDIDANFGIPISYYKLVVTEAGVYHITMDWNVGSDVDMFVCPEAGVADLDCDFTAATANHPEADDFALEPGTYYIVANDFAEDAAGTVLSIQVDHGPPAPPAVKAAMLKAAAATARRTK